MLLVLFPLIIFSFLLVGSVVFLLCVTVPITRRFALSAALWWAMWGPFSVAFLSLAGVVLVGTAFTGNGNHSYTLQNTRLLSTFGWGYLIVAGLLTTIAASSASWLHQFLMHRCTYALFRLYATVVVSGIRSVFGWCISWWMLDRGVAYVWVWSILGMVSLVAAFGLTAYKGAYALRGQAPTKFTWITEVEFLPSSRHP